MRLNGIRLEIILFLFLTLIVEFTASPLEGQPEIPVSIDKTSTRFLTYGRIEINDTVKLTVAIKNTGDNDSLVVIKVSGKNLDITPEGNRTVNIRHGYQATTFDYSVTSNQTGKFQVIVELWYNNQSIDFNTLQIEFQEPPEEFNLSDILPKNITPYEFKLFFVYMFAFFMIFLSYFKLKNVYFLYLIIILCVVFIALMENIAKVLESAISPNVGRVEPILALILTFSIAMLVLLINKKREFSAKIANITIFIIILPFFFDWFVPPDFFPASFVIVNFLSSLLLSFVLDWVIKKIKKK
jgi:hypothetical protein